MTRSWDFSGLDSWMEDVVVKPSSTDKPELIDEYDESKTYPYRADTVPPISYVELAWLDYYRVDPIPGGKKWKVTTCDNVEFVSHDRRTAVREAQAYCVAYERKENLQKHLPKPLRPITPKVDTSGPPPF